jgi:predicted dehydrogenase
MVINRRQCEELVNASRKHKTFLMEGMWLRFLPSIQHLLSLLKEGKIGNIVSIKANMCYKAPYDPESRYFDPELGGGSLLDLGIYPVFLSYLLLGKPDTIKAIGTLSKDKVDVTCSVLFHYRNGQHAVLESSLVTGTDLPAEISGDKGIIKILNPWFEKSKGLELAIFGEEKTVYETSWDGHGLQFETAEVLKCLERKQIESEIISHQFSLDIMEILDEIREQIQVIYKKYE